MKCVPDQGFHLSEIKICLFPTPMFQRTFPITKSHLLSPISNIHTGFYSNFVTNSLCRHVEVQLEVNQLSCPLNDLLQLFSPCDLLLQSKMPPSSGMDPEWPARGVTNIGWLIFVSYVGAFEADTTATE